MAWRLDKSVVRGEIDNRTKGRVTGRIWFAGRDEPVILDLRGNAWRDIAGQVLRFTNPDPVTSNLTNFAPVQNGVAGDITASRKAKVPDCSMEELGAHYIARTQFPWHWGNSLYLEWYSKNNGRALIESADFTLEVDGPVTWHMSEEEERKQHAESLQAFNTFMEELEEMALDGGIIEEEGVDFDDEQPHSQTEAEADAEAARMDLLINRIYARLNRENLNEGDLERVMEEERERLRRERGEPEPEPLTPEEEEERLPWVEQVNAAAEEALERGDDLLESRERHPLVERCSNLATRLHQEVKAEGWLKDTDPAEHPLRDIVDGVMFASAKMAGAFSMSADKEWPPDPLFAGDTLVRLKKARKYLAEAIAGLDAADADSLANPAWRTAARAGITTILNKIHHHIAEVRDIIKD